MTDTSYLEDMTFGGRSSNGSNVAEVEDGAYVVKLIEIGKPFDREFKEKMVTKAPFTFEVQGGEYAGATIVAFVPIKSWGEKATIYKMAAALTGRTALDAGEVFRPSDLIGKLCKVLVSVNIKQVDADGNETESYANITNYQPNLGSNRKKTSTGVANATEAAELAEEKF